jgi:hypothetical protein
VATESLCWTCSRCRADKCAWVATGAKVWQMAREWTDSYGTELRVVQECAFYDGDGPEYTPYEPCDPDDIESAIKLVIDKGLSQEKAANRYGIDGSTVGKHLRKAVKAGKVVRHGRGVYAWAE